MAKTPTTPTTANAGPPAPATVSNKLCARRGSQWLSQEELHAHLAALLRVDNVGTLLGAGASSGPLGGQTIKQLWKAFTADHARSCKWLVENKFLENDSSETPPNIEALADTIEVARLEWGRQKDATLPALVSAQADLQRSVVRASLLQKDWWTTPTAVGDFPAELSSHRQLLQKVTAARQPGQPAPWIFSTNYDLAVEWAAESIGLQVINGFSGLHYRTFSPHNFDLAYRNAQARGEARFGTYNIYLAKLHGSLTWKALDNVATVEYPAQMALPLLTDFLDRKNSTLDSFLVLPSAAKYLQTVGFVLGELFRRFTEFLSRPQTCLITSGYSFADDHLNRVILSALQNPTLHLVAYVPELGRDEHDQMTCPKDRPWLKRLVDLGGPQVTLFGGGASAYFSGLVNHMPDPAFYDEQAAAIRSLLKDLREFSKGPHA